MSALDSLPADQRAVLQLVLKQGRTYEQIASMLRLHPDAVADRAHAALDALGPEPPAALSADRRAEVADYLLGQMSATGRARVRDELETSAAARAWARVVRAELRPIGGDELPEVPADPREAEEAFDALSARREAHERHESSSRLGGVLLLAGLAAILVAAILWATGVIGGGDDDGDIATTPSTTTQPQDVRPIAQANLTPTGDDSDALGVAFIVSGDDQQAIRVDVEKLPRDVRQPRPRAGACIFLTAGERSQFVGCFQEVDRKGSASASGVLQSEQGPVDVRSFERIVVTRETGTDQPERPGRTILSGQIVAPTAGQDGGTGTPPPAEGG